MICGVGCDLCGVARIERSMRTERFVQRVFTEREREYLQTKPDRALFETAAGLFCAKEAVAKALGTGFRGFFPWDVEIVPDDLGRPRCTLLRGAQQRFRALGARYIWVSISHSDGMACAMAVIEAESPTPAAFPTSEEVSP